MLSILRLISLRACHSLPIKLNVFGNSREIDHRGRIGWEDTATWFQQVYISHSWAWVSSQSEKGWPRAYTVAEGELSSFANRTSLRKLWRTLRHVPIFHDSLR